jgi:hypothetical protein
VVADNDLDAFARRMRERGRNIEVAGNRLVQEVALVVDRELVMGTPVDTGRARSNWQVSVAAPTRDQIAAYRPGLGGSSGPANTQAAMDQAAQAIKARQPEQDVFISNNLPYIKRLNEGHSAQAPAGFVERAIKRGLEVVRRARILRDGN